ncbi:MAG TPA: hypothetical protein VK585_04680 [Jiangellaceae bacterium]|nr:hypothetical protein [Jiangellaceae bacterium]
MRDTDTQDAGSFPQADQPTDDREGVVTPTADQAEQAEQAEPVADEADAPLTDEPIVASDEEGSAELMPGEVPAEPAAAGLAEGATETMRARWQELQLRFVDDPSGVAGEARSLVGEAVQAVTGALADQQRRLDSWSSAEGGDTEQLRVVVQQYREFFDRVLDRAV